jgi:O-antigen/teichoic acid export membrane protein
MNAPPGLGRRLASNTLHAATGRIAGVLVWLVLTPPILRALGPEGFAVWSLFFALTGYFASLDFGLAQGTLQRVAAARERGEARAGRAFATLATLGYLMLGALWLVLALLFRDALMSWLRVPAAGRDAAGFAIVAGALVFAISGLANVTMAVLQGSGRFDLANRVLLTLTAVQAVGIPVVLRARWGLVGLVVNIGVGWALGAAIGAWLVRRAWPEFRWTGARESLSYLRDALRFGGPMQVGNTLSVLHTHLDKFLLARFVTLAAVTPYELGFRVATSASGVPQLLLLAVLPAAAAIHAGESAARLRELYVRGSRYVLAAGAIVLAALLGSADRLYAVWLGAEHREAALALRGLAVTGAIAIATGMGTAIARGISRTDLEAWFAAVALAVHLGLSLWLVPLYGMRGALVAILAGNLIGAALFLLLLAGTLGWPRARMLLEPCGVPLVAAALGAAAGLALDRALPAAHGALGWVSLSLVTSLAAGVALAVTLATRFVGWDEARRLLFGRAQAVPWRS